jgi:hypothetical protein
MNVLELARALEIRAEKTYLDCAGSANHPALKAVFTLLAQAEHYPPGELGFRGLESLSALLRSTHKKKQSRSPKIQFVEDPS